MIASDTLFDSMGVYLLLWCSPKLCSGSPVFHCVYTVSTLNFSLSLNHHLCERHSSSPLSPTQLTSIQALFTYTNSIQQISSSMSANLLALNSSKTEFVLIDWKSNLTKYTTPHLTPLNTLLATLSLSLMSNYAFRPNFGCLQKLLWTA